MTKPIEQKSIDEKFFEIQGKLTGIVKDAVNPYHKSSYFDINSLLKQLKPLLQERRIRLKQGYVVLDGSNAIETTFIDLDTGERDTSTVLLPQGLDAQKIGAATTYLRRYSLVTYFGLEALDDDGNQASGLKTKKKPKVVANGGNDSINDLF